MNRVVVTGMGGICPLGDHWDQVSAALKQGKSAVTVDQSYAQVQGLQSHLVAPVQDFVKPSHYPRRKVRSMGRVALMAVRSCEMALTMAGLLDDPVVQGGRLGVAFGSATGSPPAMEAYARQIGVLNTLHGITAAEFVRLMSHTCAPNIAQFFGSTGRVIPTTSACTSGSQGIGYAYETIKWGLQDVMLAGGAEELHLIGTALFDILNVSSTANTQPEHTPRPFDQARDGLVIGEGAASLVLESLDHAQKRGATIFGEIIGFATNSDGHHMITPSIEAMEQVQNEALADANLKPEAIDYVNAHGTATETGDLAETKATRLVFERKVPISSLKGNMGHTLGACGAIEAWLCLHMLREGWVAPTLNLEQVDPACADLDYLQEVTALAPQLIMSNNFAIGGVNTSLIFKAWST